MISPRSAELNQMHFYNQQNNQNAQTHQPTQQNQIVLPHHNAGFYNYNGYNNSNNNYNNNYTTNATAPQSNSSSFSLPSVPQPVYMDQQAIPEDDKYRPVYYYSTQPHQPQQPQVQLPQQVPPPAAYAPQQLPHHDYSYPHGLVDQHAQQQPSGQLLQHAQQQSSGIPLPLAHPGANLQHSGSIGGLNHNQTQEEAPFPGVLDPQYRSNPPFHPRSQTYPSESSNLLSKKRLSSTSSSNSVSASTLGMTPETARRNRCSICQKQFKRPSSLQTHVYSHTGEKPFACSWDNCGRLFSVRSNMIRHRKLHERDAKLKNDSPLNSSESSHSSSSQLEESHLSKLDDKDSLNGLHRSDISDEKSVVKKLDELALKNGNSSVHDVNDPKNKGNTSNGSGSSTIPQLVHPTNSSAPSEFQLGW